MGGGSRTAVVVALSSVLALAPGVATAATVETAIGTGGYSVITFAAALGEANDVVVEAPIDSDAFLVVDEGVELVAGANCHSLTAHRALCRRPPWGGTQWRVEVELGDGPDRYRMGARIADAGGAPGLDASLSSTNYLPFLTVDGGPGDDVLSGLRTLDDAPVFLRDGAHELRGGEGDDIVTGSVEILRSLVYGDAGDDVVLGVGFGRNDLHGGPGSDIVEDRQRNNSPYAPFDYLFGEAGDDTLVGGYARDRLVGGDGNDRLDMRDHSGGDYGWCDSTSDPTRPPGTTDPVVSPGDGAADWARIDPGEDKLADDCEAVVVE